LKTGSSEALPFQMTVLAEIVLYRPLLQFFLKSTGSRWSDVGSNFVGYWLLAIVPAGVALVLVLSQLRKLVIRRRRDRLRSLMITAWLVNVALLAFSLFWYARHLHG